VGRGARQRHRGPPFSGPRSDRSRVRRSRHVIREIHIGRVHCGCDRTSRGASHPMTRARAEIHPLRRRRKARYRYKKDLASLLGIDPRDLRVLSRDVGGNFGSKNRVYVEFGLALWASRKLGRPVKFTASRSEAVPVRLSRAGPRHGGRARASSRRKISRDARLQPLQRRRALRFALTVSKGSGLITGCYDIAAATLRSRAVLTTTAPTNPYRSSGPTRGQLCDRAPDRHGRRAPRHGPDRAAPEEPRRPEAMPYRNAVGMTLRHRHLPGQHGSCDTDRRLGRVRGPPAGTPPCRGKLLGRGLSNYVESSIGSPKERAEITVTPAGRVRVVIGTQPSGQGHETSFAQVVSSLLSVPVEAIDIIVGDTDVVSVGGGSHSGRSMRHAGDGVLHGRKGADRKRGRKSRRTCWRLARAEIQVCRRALLGTARAEGVRLSGIGATLGGSLLPKELSGGLAVVARQRDARSGIPERMRDLRVRGRSGNRRSRHHAIHRGR